MGRFLYRRSMRRFGFAMMSAGRLRCRKAASGCEHLLGLSTALFGNYCGGAGGAVQPGAPCGIEARYASYFGFCASVSKALMFARWVLWIALIFDPMVAGSSPEVRRSNV